ncbi:Redoxin, partial [Klenkia terrae]
VKRLLVALVAAAALLAGCTSGSSSDDGAQATGPAETGVQDVDTALQPCPEQTGDTVQATDALPALTFECIGGGSLDLSRAPGVPTVINVWGSWCGPCREELPLVQELADAAGEEVQVLGVVTTDTLGAADSFAADAGVTFPNAFDQQDELLSDLGRRGAPFTFFVAADGTLAYTEAGAVSSYDELRQLVADHLGVTL